MDGRWVDLGHGGRRNPRDKDVVFPDFEKLVKSSLPRPPTGCFWTRLETGEWKLESESNLPSGVGAGDAAADSEEPQEANATELPAFVEHVVMPNDTLTGIILRYRVSKAQLKRHNPGVGSGMNDFRLLKTLRIPTENFTAGVTLQGDTPEVKLQVVRNATKLPEIEARFYLEDHDWDVQRSIDACKADDEWEDLATAHPVTPGRSAPGNTQVVHKGVPLSQVAAPPMSVPTAAAVMNATLPTVPPVPVMPPVPTTAIAAPVTSSEATMGSDIELLATPVSEGA